ncbi:hypothetical protein HDU98_009285, partial [Podochytrium sp. JEL0797]
MIASSQLKRTFEEFLAANADSPVAREFAKWLPVYRDAVVDELRGEAMEPSIKVESDHAHAQSGHPAIKREPGDDSAAPTAARIPPVSPSCRAIGRNLASLLTRIDSTCVYCILHTTASDPHSHLTSACTHTASRCPNCWLPAHWDPADCAFRATGGVQAGNCFGCLISLDGDAGIPTYDNHGTQCTHAFAKLWRSLLASLKRRGKVPDAFLGLEDKEFLRKMKKMEKGHLFVRGVEVIVGYLFREDGG